MRPLTLVATVLSLVLLGLVPVAAGAQTATSDGPGDAVVVAVVDSGFSPYHLDFRANLMPQALDQDPSNDLPLDQDPATWLPGYSTAGTASYAPINVTLPDDEDAVIEELEDADGVHEQIPQSADGNINLRWIPNTKIIGALDFGGGTDGFFAGNTNHGNGTSSVSVGNLHGTCPECLVVLIRYGGNNLEAANNWAMNQPWIDVVTNSFGFNSLPAERERVYSGSDTELQRTAIERGQTILFSAGNGVGNNFTIPNTSYSTSQPGPDWIITVGAVTPNGSNYTGGGKSADIASIGTGYPSGYGGTTVSGTGSFGGTSNATPVTAGTYARALWKMRNAMAGPSRTQADGVISVGAFTCGSAVAACPAGDGALTGQEMRTGLFHSVTRTPAGMTIGAVGGLPAAPAEGETELMSEGHGSLFARVAGDEAWEREVAAIVDTLSGVTAPLARTQQEHDWMVVDSYCRQEVWGSWGQGYYIEGETTLPGPSPDAPLRSAIAQTCPTVFGAMRDYIGTTPEGPASDPND